MEIATKLGKNEDLLLYRKYTGGTKKTYQAIRNTKEHPLDTDRQCTSERYTSIFLIKRKRNTRNNNL